MSAEALRKVFADFGISFDDKELKNANATVDTAIKKLGTLASAAVGDRVVAQLSRMSGAFANFANRLQLSRDDSARIGQIATGAAGAYVAIARRAVAASFAWADSFRETADRLRLTAAQVRVSTAQLQEFEFAGAEAGVGADQMAAALTQLRDRAREVAIGGGLTGNAFARLGVQVRTASGRMRETGQIADDVANRFERITNPIRRARLAQELFGASGQRLQAILHRGAGGLAELRDEFYQLGGGITQEAIEAARRYGQQINRLNLVGQAWRAQLAMALLPVLTTVVRWTREVYLWFVNMTRGTDTIRVAMYALIGVAAALGLALLYAFAPVLIPIAAVAAAVLGVVLIVDDLIGTFRGADSATRRWLNGVLGAENAAALIRGVGTAWHWVHDQFLALWTLVQRASSHPAFRFISGVMAAGNRFTMGAFREVAANARVLYNTATGDTAGAQRAFAETGGGAAYAAMHPGWQPPAAAPATPATTLARAGVATAPTGPRLVQHHRTVRIDGGIHVHGAHDPQATAREVRREIERHEQERADEQHPQPPVDDHEGDS